jgi:hypothetical protein
MRLGAIAVGIVTLATCTACASEYHPEYHPQSSYSVSQTVHYGTTIMQVGSAPPLVGFNSPAEAQPSVATPEEAVPAVDPSQVAIFESQSQQLDRPSEVIGVVDVAVAVGDRDASLAMVRRRAAEMGADAVVGVEFRPGDHGGPTHVSGLAVRLTHGGHGHP